MKIYHFTIIRQLADARSLIDAGSLSDSNCTLRPRARALSCSHDRFFDVSCCVWRLPRPPPRWVVVKAISCNESFHWYVVQQHRSSMYHSAVDAGNFLECACTLRARVRVLSCSDSPSGSRLLQRCVFVCFGSADSTLGDIQWNKLNLWVATRRILEYLTYAFTVLLKLAYCNADTSSFLRPKKATIVVLMVSDDYV